jgi:general secretion pathway protein G
MAKARGFTLIELMVVIVILGMLVALVGPNVWNIHDRGFRGAAQAQMANIAGAVDLYVLDHRALPPELGVLTQPSTAGGLPYIRTIPPDPWEQPYALRTVDAAKRAYEIVSGGEDRTIGTTDDLVHPPPPASAH